MRVSRECMMRRVTRHTSHVTRHTSPSPSYAKERKTMGTAIINHQAIAFMLADMAIGIELGRLMCVLIASRGVFL